LNNRIRKGIRLNILALMSMLCITQSAYSPDEEQHPFRDWAWDRRQELAREAERMERRAEERKVARNTKLAEIDRELSNQNISQARRDVLSGQKHRIEKEEQKEEKNGDAIRDFTLNGANMLMGMAQAEHSAKINKDENLKKALIQGRQQSASSQVNHKATLDVIDQYLKDPKKLAMITTSLVGVGTVCYYGGTLGYLYFKAKLGKPTIIRETSRRSKIETAFESIFKKKKEKSRMGEIIMAPEIDEQLKDIAEDVKSTKRLKDEYFNCMLYGPPGTGKTMFAKELARHTGLDYAIMSGADLTQLPVGKAITELHLMFDWAENCKDGTIIFIDECEAFLANRAMDGVSEDSRKLTQAFLSRVEKPSHPKIMLIFATNCPEQLDPAALSRISRRVEIQTPAVPEAAKLFDMYLNKLAMAKGVEFDESFDSSKEELVATIVSEKFAGREIEEAVKNIIRKSRHSPEGVVTTAVAKKVITLQANELRKQRENKKSILLGE
jgi:ATPase family AAA domain-containing protein 3A/B